MSEERATWTIDRLARLAAAALAAGALAPQPNGRIREVPDVRTIRYYTSIGLLDRPGAMRGRTALYGRRHLAQLVAIKRLQADGLTLTEVQERLLGSDEAAAEQIAMLPPDIDDLAPSGADPVAAPTNGAAAPASRQRFWSTRPAVPSRTDSDVSHSGPAVDERRGADIGAQSDADTDALRSTDSEPEAELPEVLTALRLSPTATLLLAAGPARIPDPADRAAIAQAAQPLLDLLHRLGLSEA